MRVFSPAFRLQGLLRLVRGASGGADEFALNGQTFTVPAGFELVAAAGPPLVDRPISADFDDAGRLYVTESRGSSDPVEIQVKRRPHRIVRTEDSDGDGVFDERVVFADGLMFPEGALRHAGSLYGKDRR